jgi:hypothetical protein
MTLYRGFGNMAGLLRSMIRLNPVSLPGHARLNLFIKVVL